MKFKLFNHIWSVSITPDLSPKELNAIRQRRYYNKNCEILRKYNRERYQNNINGTRDNALARAKNNKNENRT